MATFNFEDYRQPWETGPHWELKKEFMEAHHSDFDEDRLLCLAQAYSNMELMGCSYPAPVMELVHSLSLCLKGWRKAGDSSKNAAGETSRKGKRKASCLEDANEKSVFIKFCPVQGYEQPESQANKRTCSESFSNTTVIASENEPMVHAATSVNSLNSQFESETVSDINRPIKAVFGDLKEDEIAFMNKFIQKVQIFVNKQHNAASAIGSAASLLDCAKDVSYSFSNDPDSLKSFSNFLCDFSIKTVFVSSGVGTQKKLAKQNAAEQGINAMFSTNVWIKKTGANYPYSLIHNTDPQRRRQKAKEIETSIPSKIVPDATPSGNIDNFIGRITQSTLGENSNYKKTMFHQVSSFVLNEPLFRNTYEKELVILDKNDVSNVVQSPACILNQSVSFCRKVYQCQVLDAIPTSEEDGYRANVMINNEIIATAIAKTKTDAKAASASLALQKLKKCVYTLRVKSEMENGFIVKRDQVAKTEVTSNAISEDNIGCKMLRLMGWTGGGISENSIAEPISAVDSGNHRRGLGFTKKTGDVVMWKLEAIIRDFSKTDTTSDLIFSTDFSKEERALLHRLALRYGLSSVSYGKEENRQLFIKHKIPLRRLLNILKNVGGSTQKYELVDQSK